MNNITFSKPKFYKKGWGSETWIVNNNYCGKILKFNRGAEFSTHFHVEKEETFYVLDGVIEFTYFDLDCGEEITRQFIEGDVINIPKCQPHRVKAISKSTIIEISTHHEDSDSYRIKKGDSQKK